MEIEELERRALEALDVSEVTRLCSELVRVPSENPPGDVSEAAAIASNWLSERGHELAIYEPGKGRVNVVSSTGDGEPHLLFLGHLDVVPAGDRERWSFDPFCGEIRDGKVLGRGATDMKGGVACAMVVYSVLSDLVEELGGKLTLALTCDEETGGRLGAGWLVEKRLLDADACIVLEPTTPYAVILGERGICWLKLRAYGRPAHGSVPRLGLNAIMLMARALEKLMELDGERGEIPEEAREVLVDMERAIEVLRTLGVGEGVQEEIVRACSRVTVNVGVIRGGTKVNVVPDYCEAEVDVRIPYGVSPDSIIERARRLISELGGKVEVEALSRVEPSFTSPRAPVCRALEEAAEDLLGCSLMRFLMPATTDARYLRARGVPTVVYGPGAVELAHSYDEHVSIEHLEHVSKVLCAASVRFLGKR